VVLNDYDIVLGKRIHTVRCPYAAGHRGRAQIQSGNDAICVFLTFTTKYCCVGAKLYEFRQAIQNTLIGKLPDPATLSIRTTLPEGFWFIADHLIKKFAISVLVVIQGDNLALR